MPAVSETVSFDEMPDVLSNIQRRTLLVALLEQAPQDDSPIVITDDETERDAVNERIRMDHVRLPKLAEYGLIGWDSENNEVSKGPAFAAIRPLLGLLDAQQDELPESWI